MFSWLSWLWEYPDDAPLIITARPDVDCGDDLPIDRARKALALCAMRSGDDMKIISPPDKTPKNGRKGRSGRKPIGDRAMTALERATKRLDKINPNRKRYKKRASKDDDGETDYGQS